MLKATRRFVINTVSTVKQSIKTNPDCKCFPASVTVAFNLLKKTQEIAGRLDSSNPANHSLEPRFARKRNNKK